VGGWIRVRMFCRRGSSPSLSLSLFSLSRARSLLPREFFLSRALSYLERLIADQKFAVLSCENVVGDDACRAPPPRARARQREKSRPAIALQPNIPPQNSCKKALVRTEMSAALGKDWGTQICIEGGAVQRERVGGMGEKIWKAQEQGAGAEKMGYIHSPILILSRRCLQSESTSAVLPLRARTAACTEGRDKSENKWKNPPQRRPAVWHGAEYERARLRAWIPPADRAADADSEGALVPIALGLVERRVALVEFTGVLHVLMRVAMPVAAHGAHRSAPRSTGLPAAPKKSLRRGSSWQ